MVYVTTVRDRHSLCTHMYIYSPDELARGFTDSDDDVPDRMGPDDSDSDDDIPDLMDPDDSDSDDDMPDLGFPVAQAA